MSDDLADDFAHFKTTTPSHQQETTAKQSSAPRPAFRCAVVGVGGCGGQIADAFKKRGYAALAVNSAQCDLDAISPEIPKYNLNEYNAGQGAGQDREVGRRLVQEQSAQIRAAMAEVFGDDFDKIIVCMSLGGGTGSGGGPEVVRIAKKFVTERGMDPDKAVIVFAVLPDPATGGSRQCYNAMKAFAQLERLGGPRLYIDNARLQELIEAKFVDGWTPINDWVVKTFHRFNTFANTTSSLCVCDARDLENTLKDRFIFSAFTVGKLQNRHSIGGIMTAHLANSMFAKTDITSASTAACLIILNRSAVQDLGMNEIKPAFTSLNAMMKPGSSLHTGVYLEDLRPSASGEPAPDLFCFVMLGNLDIPTETLNKLFDQARHYDPGYGSLSAFLDETE